MIDLKNLESESNKKFDKNQVENILNIIDESRKIESGYIAHNANFYANLAEKRDEIKNVKELFGADKLLSDKEKIKLPHEMEINQEKLDEYLKTHSYADLMAVAKNMPIDDNLGLKLSLADFYKDNAEIRQRQIIDSLNPDNVANRLATMLEIADIMKNGEVSLKEKHAPQEQMSADELKEQSTMKFNPYDMVNRGTMSLYFRDKNVKVKARNAINIASVMENRSNLANLMNYDLNQDSYLAVIKGLEASNTLKITILLG